MDRRVIISDQQTATLSSSEDAPAPKRLVSVALDDSWSTLDQEVALIDRFFGGEIADLFGRQDDGRRQQVRG